MKAHHQRTNLCILMKVQYEDSTVFKLETSQQYSSFSRLIDSLR